MPRPLLFKVDRSVRVLHALRKFLVTLTPNMVGCNGSRLLFVSKMSRLRFTKRATFNLNHPVVFTNHAPGCL